MKLSWQLVACGDGERGISATLPVDIGGDICCRDQNQSVTHVNFCCKAGLLNTVLSWSIHFGASLKWPLRELQFLALWCFTFQPRRLLLVVAWDLWNVHWHFVIRLLSALASQLWVVRRKLGNSPHQCYIYPKNLVLFSSTHTVNIKSPFLVLALTVTLEVNSVQLKKTHTLEALVYLLWFSQHLWIITSCCDQRCIQNMFRHENMNLIYHHKLNELNDFAI